MRRVQPEFARKASAMSFPPPFTITSTSWCAFAGSARTCRSGGCDSLAQFASTSLLVDQLRDFPAGAHDDGPDALEMALRLAEEVWNGKRSEDGLGDRLPLRT